MAKAAKKKVTSSKPTTASKKTAPKKTTTKKKAAAKPETKPSGAVQAGSPADKRDKELTKKALIAMGQEMIDKKGRAPFTVAKDVREAAKRAKELNESRNEGEAELAATLWHLREQGAHTHEGQERIEDYCDQVLNISPNKARSLINSWDVWQNVLGLPNHLLRTVDWGKYKLFVPAVRSGAIRDQKAFLEHLPLLVKSGETRTTETILKKKLQKITNSGDTSGENVVKLRNLKFGFPEDEADGFSEVLNSFRVAEGLTSDSQALHRALDFAASARISDGGARALGVLNLTNMIARTNNVIPVLIAQDESETFDNLGVHPVTKIFGRFDTKGGSDEGIQFCLAASKADAAAHLGVKESQVREFSFTVTDLLKPEATYAPPTEGLLDDVADAGLSADEDDAEVADLTNEEIETAAIEFDESHVDRYVELELDGETVNAVITQVNTEDRLVTIKLVDEDFEVQKGARKKVMKFSDIAALLEVHEEEEVEEEEEAEAEEVEADSHVGSRVSVEYDGTPYEGTVTAEDGDTLSIAFDDGTEANHDLSEVTFLSEEEAAESEGDEESEEEEEEEETDATEASSQIPQFDPNDIDGMTAEVNRVGKLVKAVDPKAASKILAKHKEFKAEAQAQLAKAKDTRTNHMSIALPRLIAFAYKTAEAIGANPYAE